MVTECPVSCPLQCGAAFQEDDVIVLNGTKEDVETLKGRMEERRQKAKLGKVMRPSRLPLPEASAASASGPVANHRAALLAAAGGCAAIEVAFATYGGRGSGETPVGARGAGRAVLLSCTQLLHR